VQFCIRDDDTSFFTSPDELERAYGDVIRFGPVSLAVVPFCRAGTSKGVPAQARGRWTVHPLHDNVELVQYLREGIAAGRFEIMLHGYSHDERHGRPEFARGADLATRVVDGRRYLEELLGARIRVFVPPHNTIGSQGLQAIARAGLHLGGTAGLRSGWSPFSRRTWQTWLYLRRWERSGGAGVPWILDMGDHREIAGTAVTPSSTSQRHTQVFESALKVDGVFCAATHYWELDVTGRSGGDSVRDQLRALIDRAMSSRNVCWRSVGDVVADGRRLVPV
jgi:predicted deacetylase